MSYISRQAAIDALDEIRHALWEIDIPSPTVPEYIEHHEQVQSVWKLLDKKQKELYALPSAQPEYFDYTDIDEAWEYYAKEQDANLTDNAKQIKEAMWVGYRIGLKSAQPEDKCSECDAWNKYKNYPREQRWIPCSERLPEEAGWYIVTMHNGRCNTLWYSTLHGWEWEMDVIAWMPLPEPYQEEGAK